MTVCPANAPKDATIAITEGAGGAFTCAIQLQGENGQDLAGVGAVAFYLSKNSDGSTLCADSTDTTEIAIATDGLLVENVTDVAGWLISESDGDIGLTVTVASGKVAYLVLIMPDGRLVISDAMSYAG